MATLDSETIQNITAAVDDRFDQQLEFTAELIRHPSLRDTEKALQDVMFVAMQDRGLSMDRWRVDPGQLSKHPGFGPVTVSYDQAVNVVGTYTPEHTRGRSLILNSHADVVPAGPESQWSRSPWDPQLVDGWLYGRGSGDMKAGTAANLFAFDALRAAGLRPTAPIIFQSVVDEEATGNGALAALLRGYTADAVLIPEPEENMLVRANVGVIWFTVRVAGKPTHVREMATGFNAIDAAYTVIAELRELEDSWNAERSEHRYFEDLEHPINFNIGKIVGGDWPSSVPAWCEIEVRAATYPGVGADRAWAQIEQCLDRTAEKLDGVKPMARRTGFYAEGYVQPEGSEAEQVLERAHRVAFGAPLESFTTPGYLDARVFTLYGNMPTLVYGPRSEAIHGFDERVHVESVRNITKSVALFIAEWCGVEPVPEGAGSAGLVA